MTLPREKTNAVLKAEAFLMKLARMPSIPPQIRREAAWLLKHYPTPFDLKQSAEALPDTWGKPRERKR